MAIYIGLLRGINVGGKAKVAMAELRALLTELGFEDVQTLLQSGNIVFRSGGKQTTSRLESQLEKAVAKELGVACDCIVRTVAEWHAIIAHNPYPAAATRDPSHLLVFCLKHAPSAAQLAAARAAIKGRETIEVRGKEAYLVYPDGIGTSKLTSTILESKLGGRGTGRNWNTVLKLAAAAEE